jgi:hypothetical protein
VEAYRESAEPRVDAGLIDVDGYAEFAVGIRNALQVEVDFVDCECEVREVDSDEDVAPVRDVAGRAGLRFRVAGANEDAVENCLSPTCCLSCVKTLHGYPTLMVYILRMRLTSGIRNCHTKKGPIVSQDTFVCAMLPDHQTSVIREWRDTADILVMLKICAKWLPASERFRNAPRVA